MRQVDIQNLQGGVDTFTAYEYDDFPWEKLNRLSFKTSQNKKIKEYLYQFGTFDIETTSVYGDKPYGFMYHWQMCIAGELLYGRTWPEFVKTCLKLQNIYRTTSERRFVIYIHNLGFEFQFIKDFLQKEFGIDEIFSVSSRKPLRMCAGGLEFRCSLKQTNMSLEMATKNEKGMLHAKQAGDLDYSVFRTPSTYLNDTEFGYCMADVLSLYELIWNRLKNEHDTLETIPMTSTGYVRREVRKSCQKTKGYREFFLKQIMTPELYGLMKESGRGGDTHANRHMSGRIWSDVHAYDVQSSYPAMLMLKKFPITKFQAYGEIESKKELTELLESKACLFRLTLKGNIHLKDEIAMPYLSDSKCRDQIKARYDNGRILSADYLETTVTDIDFKIIQEQYDFDEMYVNDIYIADYGYLPECILSVVRDYFYRKTELKYKIEQLKKTGKKDEIEELKKLYMKSKNKLNAIFGMMYTDPVRDIVTYDFENGWKETENDIPAALEKFYKSRNSFLVYAWGIWTTAHARNHLAQLVKATGQTNTIYCDTDSSYAVNPDIYQIEKMNTEIRKECDVRNAYADIGGKRYYMGIYEFDGVHDRFKTLGAKKYVYEDNGELTVTIAGVAKYEGSKELGVLENFEPGFIFREAGGNEIYYNDEGIHEITIKGEKIITASNCAILPSTYMVGCTPEYGELIGADLSDLIKLKKERQKNEKTRSKKSGKKRGRKNGLQNECEAS